MSYHKSSFRYCEISINFTYSTGKIINSNIQFLTISFSMGIIQPAYNGSLRITWEGTNLIISKQLAVWQLQWNFIPSPTPCSVEAGSSHWGRWLFSQAVPLAGCRELHFGAIPWHKARMWAQTSAHLGRICFALYFAHCLAPKGSNLSWGF